MAFPTWLYEIHPIWLALLATCFTWGVTALGAATVFFFRTVNRAVIEVITAATKFNMNRLLLICQCFL